MYNNVIKHTGFAFFLLLFQLLVLNNINFFGYANPYVYILVILLLPYSTPRWAMLLIGFLLGLVVDYFSNTLGLHATATLVLSYLRPIILSQWRFKSVQDVRGTPNISNTSLEWFSLYITISVLIHHLILFFLETFTLNHLGLTLLRVIISSGLSVVTILIIELWRLRKKE
ncbi:MAG: hypothetical protein PWR03_1114 [Tenuifilum sp.]|jgi:hypothetical protein|uniref:rod shape-determining protein MreD n=1 Tax=Tenuifilum sp. TaxID=2760880 RepID=UPI0024AAB046|nr:rod shape-determining protein MreD [Tenuifilum sp.]MDI3526931.1 hypothetical protein [Tenuifilum sp.]